MKHSRFRAAAAAMTAALLLTTLTGCSKDGSIDIPGIGGGNGGKSGMLEVSLDHSYASEQVKIEDIGYTRGSYAFGDKVLISGADGNYNDAMYLYDPADNSTKKIEFSYPKTLDDGAQAWMNSFFLDADGNANVLFSASSWTVDADGMEQYEDLGMTIEVYDQSFQVIETKSVDKEALGIDYIETITSDAQGNYYITSWDDSAGGQIIGIYDKDFRKTGQIQGSIQYVQGMFTGKNGEVFISYYTQEGESAFGTLDAASGTVQPVTVEGMPQWFNQSFAGCDDSYDLYLYDSESLYGVSLQKGVCEEVVNWMNSDFLGNNIGNASQLPDGRFLVTSTTYTQNSSTSELWVLSPRDPDAFKDVTLISMAGLYLPDELGNAVLTFNRTHDKERIAMVNYGQYSTEEDYNAGLTKFKNDMTSGIVADIIVTSGLPYESLANKGIFEDLRPYMADMTDADYFTSFFNSMAYGDKLYNIGFSFDVNTIEGKASLVGKKQGLTVSEYMDLIHSLPDGTEAFTDMTKESALYTLAMGNLRAFTDVRSATCSFSTPEFISLLEFCNQFPAEFEDKTSGMSDSEMQTYWEEQQSQYLNDKTALCSTWISGLRDTYTQRMTNFGDAEVTRVGYPKAADDTGNGGCFSAYNTLAMSANSPNKEIVWGFMQSMLSDEYQEKLLYSLPVKRSAFHKMAEEAMKPPTYTDENGEEVVYENTIWRGEEEIRIPDMPKSFADEIEAYIDGITVNNYYDEQIYNIVNEEAGMYFSGDQTAEKTADMIQSRVSLYLSEQG